jgi:hypothetical protein
VNFSPSPRFDVVANCTQTELIDFVSVKFSNVMKHMDPIYHMTTNRKDQRHTLWLPCEQKTPYPKFANAYLLDSDDLKLMSTGRYDRTSSRTDIINACGPTHATNVIYKIQFIDADYSFMVFVNDVPMYYATNNMQLIQITELHSNEHENIRINVSKNVFMNIEFERIRDDEFLWNITRINSNQDNHLDSDPYMLIFLIGLLSHRYVISDAPSSTFPCSMIIMSVHIFIILALCFSVVAAIHCLYRNKYKECCEKIGDLNIHNNYERIDQNTD